MGRQASVFPRANGVVSSTRDTRFRVALVAFCTLCVGSAANAQLVQRLCTLTEYPICGRITIRHAGDGESVLLCKRFRALYRNTQGRESHFPETWRPLAIRLVVAPGYRTGYAGVDLQLGESEQVSIDLTPQTAASFWAFFYFGRAGSRAQRAKRAG